MTINTSRRGFLASALALGAVPAISGCASARAFFAGGRVRLAAVGCGAQAWRDLQAFAKYSDLCEVVALCDTDMGAHHTVEALKAWPKVPRFRDFRMMYDKMSGQIDAVLVATPDHSHFCAAVQAIKLGKAVFAEAPLAHSFLECQLLKEAEEEYGAVCQMGNQGHGGAGFGQFRAYHERGEVKNVERIVAHMNRERSWHRWGGRVGGFPKGERIPDTLDWNAWLSSASYRDYSREYMFGEWRGWFDFGLGTLGDWGAHVLDLVHRFTLGGDLPTDVTVANVRGWNAYVCPLQGTVSMKFPANGRHGDITLDWWEGLHNQPPLPGGFRFDAEGGLSPSEDCAAAGPKLKPGVEIYQADGAVWQGLSHGAPLRLVGEKPPRADFDPEECDIYRNFLLAVRGEAVPRSPFRVAAPLSQVICLGVVAQRLNRGFRFDPAAGCAVGDEEANFLIRGPAPRNGWEEYYAKG